MSTEFICKLLPLVGLGTSEYIKAGHAALVLVENVTGNARYFDFGRYVTPKGLGRVRSANTDVELEIPFKANFSREGKLENLDTFLTWLDAHPEKTHGEGRLLASVCEAIDFNKAETYIQRLQGKGSIPYGAFDKKGSNCSRFVTDTILAATDDPKIRKALFFNKKFTPSTVGNVEKAAVNRKVFEVYNGTITPFKSSALKENLTNYFDKKRTISATSISKNELPKEAQKLEGTGSSAYFWLTKEVGMRKGCFRIRRYNDFFTLDFDGVFFSNELDISEAFQFTYDSNCLYCHVVQRTKKIRLEYKERYAMSLSLVQKERAV